MQTACARTAGRVCVCECLHPQGLSARERSQELFSWPRHRTDAVTRIFIVEPTKWMAWTTTNYMCDLLCSQSMHKALCRPIIARSSLMLNQVAFDASRFAAAISTSRGVHRARGALIWRWCSRGVLHICRAHIISILRDMQRARCDGPTISYQWTI